MLKRVPWGHGRLAHFKAVKSAIGNQVPRWSRREPPVYLGSS